jgi:hypothetical protein
MAAPKTTPTKLQQDQTRAAIQTTQLVKRLQIFALGGNDPQAAPDENGEGRPLELDALRIKAIEILLRKSLPDLSSVTLSGDPDGAPIKTEEVGNGAAKVQAFIDAIRSRTAGDDPAG